MGFSASGFAEEDKTVVPRKKTKSEKAAKGLGRAASSDPSPYAHNMSSFLPWAQVLYKTFRVILLQVTLGGFQGLLGTQEAARHLGLDTVYTTTTTTIESSYYYPESQ